MTYATVPAARSRCADRDLIGTAAGPCAQQRCAGNCGERTTLDRTLLFLAYFFPPRGGAGVQRSVKFAKYLPQFGWKPLVIAHGGMADHASGVMDPTLLADLPPN